MDEWIKITSSINPKDYPPQNVRLKFKCECMMWEFECEGTIVYRDGLWYRDKCFSDGEIREMFYRCRLVAYKEVEDFEEWVKCKEPKEDWNIEDED